MKDYGVIYMAWGENAISQSKQSIYSLRRFMPKVPIMVVGNDETEQAFEDGQTVETYNCLVDPFNEDRKKGFKFLAGRIKPLLAKISPFEKTLYVDADTYFQRSPLEGFQLLDKWDVALAETQTRTLAEGVAGKDECAETAEELGSSLLLYHNSGMIFWRNNERTQALFDLWAEEWQRYQGWDEQVALLRAMLRSDVLFLTLPYTWNHSVLSECYMLTHWFGAGDARFDMKQRLRQMDLKSKRPSNSPLMRIEIRPGQWIQCRVDEVEKVKEQYGLNGDTRLGKDKEMAGNDNPLVKVFSRPGQYVKMRLKDAVALGLEYEHEKGRTPQGNKMRVPKENKEVLTKEQWENFTVIVGIGTMTDEKLHSNGIHTFEALMGADVSFLPGVSQSAIETWRETL